MDFITKKAAIEFDEKLISAQEVARALSYTPHMMGPNMQYVGLLVLFVEGVKNKATGKKATAALSKVKGVGKVIVDPRQEAVGIQFTGKGKVTSKQLIEALEKAGLKGGQFGPADKEKETSRGHGSNGSNVFMGDHAGMRMDNGGMAGHGAMGRGMGCGCSMCMPMMRRAYPGYGGGWMTGGCCR